MPERACAQALAELDATFPRRYPRARQLCVHCETDEVRGAFEAVVRAHRSCRLALPVQDLLVSFGHGSALVHEDPRRFAWFVPPILARWVEGRVPSAVVIGLAREAAAAGLAPRTSAEQRALEGFFEAAAAARPPDEVRETARAFGVGRGSHPEVE